VPASFFPTDPDENAASLANLAEILFGCLDAIGAKTVVEVGAFHGKSTNEMLDWARRAEAKVIAVDPAPQPDLRAIADAHPELELLEATSHEALPELDPADAIIIDGDHNYFTLSEELRLIDERTPGARMPLLMLHDIGWPLARRDGYYAPERIPAEHRQPLARDTYLTPEEPGTAPDGMPFACVAAREGGPRNGILTAVEDFLTGRTELEFAKVPAFFGFGVIWHPAAPWAAEVATAVAPWDRNPVLERLEANRVRHMVERYKMTRRLEIAVDREVPEREVLEALAGSRAFGVAEQLSRLHGRGRPAFTREQVRRALEG
jgi:Methyltransferase domain